MADLSATLSSAIRLHQAGVLNDAATLYAEVLASNPTNVAALSNLGVLRAAQGNFDQAAEHYRKVLDLTPNDEDTLNNLGSLYHAQGKTDDAETTLRQALAHNPANPVANANLGQVLAEIGRSDDAIAAFRQAFKFDREHVDFGINLGSLLFQMGRIDEALDVFRETVRRFPGHAGAISSLGDCCAAAGQIAEAEGWYRKQIELEPKNGFAWLRLGTVLSSNGRHADAVRAYKRSAGLDTSSSAAWCEAGNSLMILGRYDEAQEALKSALSVNPNDGKANFHLGWILYGQEDLDPALEYFQNAKSLEPSLFEAHFNAALCLHRLERTDEALPDFEQVARDFPTQALAHRFLGVLYQTVKRYEEAERSGQAAALIDPDNPEIWNGLAKANLALGENETALENSDQAMALDGSSADNTMVRAQVLAQLEKPGEAMALVHEVAALPGGNSAEMLLMQARVLEICGNREQAFVGYAKALEAAPDNAEAARKSLQIKLELCDWSDYDAFIDGVVARINGQVANGKPLSYCVQDLHNFSMPVADLANASKHQGEQILKRLYAENDVPTFATSQKFDRWSSGERWPLRIGYALPYTFRHSFPMIMKELIENHDQNKFQFYGYSIMPNGMSEFDQAYRATFNKFSDLPEEDPVAGARMIFDDGIDVLIDVTGHSEINCQDIMAARPAPVQVEGMCFSLAVGGGYIDYLLTQGHFFSDEFSEYCDETLVYLPDTLFSPRQPLTSDKEISRAHCELPETAFVFANFNQSFKFEPEMFAVWMRILDRVPGSVLWLGLWREETRKNLCREADARGVDPERLIFGVIAGHGDHIARLQHAGLMLDNRFHGGGATSTDGLWAGVPMVTCPGELPGSGTGRMLANALGVPEMIAGSLADYEELAVALGNDPDRYDALREKVRSNRTTHPLFDRNRFVRNLEKSIEMMWDRSVFGGEGPIIVQPEG